MFTIKSKGDFILFHNTKFSTYIFLSSREIAYVIGRENSAIDHDPYRFILLHPHSLFFLQTCIVQYLINLIIVFFSIYIFPHSQTIYVLLILCVCHVSPIFKPTRMHFLIFSLLGLTSLFSLLCYERYDTYFT